MLAEIFVDILSVVIGIRSTTLKKILEKTNLLKLEETSTQALADKVADLSSTLRKSSELMSEIELEFAKQKELAEKWKDEASTSQNIVSLNQDEVDAVTKVFGGKLERESKKTNRKTLFWGAMFCIIGLIGGFLISRYLV